jgi:dTMP kinase
MSHQVTFSSGGRTGAARDASCYSGVRHSARPAAAVSYAAVWTSLPETFPLPKKAKEDSLTTADACATKLRGALIVFEGPDGAGKTTIVAAYSERLRQQGLAVTTLSFPGREPGTLGYLVYHLHHDPNRFGISEITPEALQTLHIAAHLDAIDRQIRGRIERGETVVLDRYWWSTWVYGTDAGAREHTLRALVECERQHWGKLTPSVLILIVRDDSLRAADAGPAWNRRLELYRAIARQEQAHYPVRIVSNDTSESDALDRVAKAVEDAAGAIPSTER